MHDEVSIILRQVRGSEQITAALQGVAFPCTKQQLIGALGERSLRWSDDTRAPIAELVRGIPLVRFHDAAQARQAVDARWARFAKSLAAVERAEERGP